MHPGWTLLIGLVVGLVIGIAITIGLRRWSRADEASQISLDTPEVTVPEELTALVGVLRAAAIVVGPHDEVLVSSEAAGGLGLVRGTRVLVPEVLQLIRDTRRTGDRVTTELTVRAHRGDDPTELLLRIAPLGPQLTLALADDLTAERRLERIRRDFVANVSHELKTPIGAIALLAEAVEDAADDPEAVRRFVVRMGIESQRLTALVSQIIELSRLQAGDPTVGRSVVPIDDVLADAVDRSRVDASTRRISLRIGGETGRRVLGDRAQLTTAVANLVDNAVIYSDDGARVAVSAHLRTDGDETSVQISVSDNGIGIAPGEETRIFERFYRVDYARSRADGGTGLGLAIVKHIAAAHRGSVSVWSRLGEGSTFTITLPAHTLQDPAPAHAAPAQQQQQLKEVPL